MGVGALDAAVLDALKGLAGDALAGQGSPHLLAALRTRDLADGEALFNEGDPADTLWVVVSGRVRVGLTVGGRHLHVGDVEPGGWVGERQLLDPGFADADAVADGATRVAGFDAESFAQLRAHDPHAASAILRSLCEDLAQRVRDTRASLDKRGDDWWVSTSPEERRGWLDGALSWLFGGRS